MAFSISSERIQNWFHVSFYWTSLWLKYFVADWRVFALNIHNLFIQSHCIGIIIIIDFFFTSAWLVGCSSRALMRSPDGHVTKPTGGRTPLSESIGGPRLWQPPRSHLWSQRPTLFLTFTAMLHIWISSPACVDFLRGRSETPARMCADNGAN